MICIFSERGELWHVLTYPKSLFEESSKFASSEPGFYVTPLLSQIHYFFRFLLVHHLKLKKSLTLLHTTRVLALSECYTIGLGQK